MAKQQIHYENTFIWDFLKNIFSSIYVRWFLTSIVDSVTAMAGYLDKVTKHTENSLLLAAVPQENIPMKETLRKTFLYVLEQSIC